ncbi:MAG: hypothetical protein R2853_09440 [Thermomicrobiales bacterium]
MTTSQQERLVKAKGGSAIIMRKLLSRNGSLGRRGAGLAGWAQVNG